MWSETNADQRVAMNHQNETQNPQISMEDATQCLWVGYTDDFQDNLYEHVFENVLTAEEKGKNKRYRHIRDQRLHLMARWMCRTILSNYEPDVLPTEWEFQPNIHGKPEIIGPGTVQKPLHFNISHTEGVVVMAISKSGRVGVDVERFDRKMDLLGLSKRYFAEIEAEALEKCPETMQNELFYRIWTLKEAYVKAIGKGLAHALDSFWFSPIDLEIGQPELYLQTQSGEAKLSDQWKAHVMRIGHLNQWIVSVVNEMTDFREEGKNRCRIMRFTGIFQPSTGKTAFE